MGTSLFSSKSRLCSILICALAVVLYRHLVEVKAAIAVTLLQGYLHANNLFFLSLLSDGFSCDQNDDSILPVLDMGYFNTLQLKFIYLSRYLAKDQFLFADKANIILKDVEARLDLQFEKNNWDFSTFNEIAVPSIGYSDIGNVSIYNDYVKKGIPFIVKGVPSRAVDVWSPDYFASSYGSHEVAVINTTELAVLHMNISDYVNIHRESKESGVLYIRSLSDIFDEYPELTEDVSHTRFGEYINNAPLVTTQIFMGMSKGSGTSYHCANFNNLFFQINGRKKWTFVSPRYNALMYPMFNEKSMDVASFLSVVALNDEEAMNESFPLYKYAPKMVATLEPGDVLFNPPWQWHMIDNLEETSIGVATRWMLPVNQHYQNTVHSNLQFLSSYIWKLYYSKMVNLQKGVRAHSATNTPPVDERFNFGKPGSAKAFLPRIFPSKIYNE